MTPEMWVTLGILAAAILLFVTEWLRVDVVALGVVMSLILTGLLTTPEAFSGFSNSAVLTIASLFIVGGAVLHTGLADMIGRRILAISGRDEKRLILVVMLTAALLSGVMSDTGTVAVLLPAIIGLARSAEISPSKLMMPLAFGSLLGGAGTLIGTPPNIIVSDLLREQGFRPFSFFSYTPLGLVLLTTGILYMLTVGRRLLPDHDTTQDIQKVETSKDLVELYQLGENLFHLRIPEESALAGKTLVASNLRREFNITLVEILRQNGRDRAYMLSYPLVRSVDTSIFPAPDTELKVGDILVARGQPEDIQKAVAFWNLAIQPAPPESDRSIINEELGIAEVLLPPRSSLVDKSLEETRFAPSYNLTVLGLTRPGSSETPDLKTARLRFGDILLVQGTWASIKALRKRRRDFVIIGDPEGATLNTRKAPIAMLVMAGMLLLIVFDVLPLAATSMLAALAMVLTGCLTMDDAYDAIDWKSVVLVAGMLPMSIALEKVGLVSLVARGATDSLGGAGPLLILGSLFLLTSLFTQVLSNTATTVLVAPIALAMAFELGIEPYAFMMAVAVAASMAFASPVASPVNTLVLGAGGYRFRDFVIVGFPLIILMLIMAVIFLPLIFPFASVGG